MTNATNPPPDLVGAEPITPGDPKRLEHLAENRGLIVRRSLLSTALGGFIPLPVMDDLVAGRVRAGLYMKLAESRHVDLPSSSADVLAEGKDASTVRNVTLTAATLVALKLTWRKFLALVAAGRGADDMTTTFQIATLVDHYCARLHVGGPITRADAGDLRQAIHACVDQTETAVLVAIFRDGGRILARSALEAPKWVSRRLAAAAERWITTGGNPSINVPTPDLGGDAPDGPWLDRASRAVEERIALLGSDYLAVLVDGFEERWRQQREKRANGGETTTPPTTAPPTTTPPQSH